MPGTIINPTRMELTRLKRQLRTAQRGHKLLRDKRDELMKQFMETVRENRALRQRVEQGLSEAHASFTVAAALMTPEMLGQSLLIPSRSVELDMSFENIMSVEVPRYHLPSIRAAALIPMAMSRQAENWMTQWHRFPGYSGICCAWRRLKRLRSCWRRR